MIPWQMLSMATVMNTRYIYMYSYTLCTCLPPSLLPSLPPSQIIVVGALAVGKTSIVMRYVHDQFQDKMSTLIAEKEKVVTVDGCTMNLQIWDTAGTPPSPYTCRHTSPLTPAGQERYQSITNRFYAESKAVMVVYDVVNVSGWLARGRCKCVSECCEQEDSWTDVDFWVKELHYYLLNELEVGMPVLFVGNKKDLVNKRDEEQKIVNFRQVPSCLLAV